MQFAEQTLYVKVQHIFGESCSVALKRFRNHVLGTPKRSFSRPLSEREWWGNGHLPLASTLQLTPLAHHAG